MTVASVARPAPPNPARPKVFKPSRGVVRAAHKVGIYGTGGIGKSSLVAMLDGVVFIDLESSTSDLDVARYGPNEGVETWADMRALLNSDALDNAKGIAIDTATTAEEWCRRHVLQNVKTEKGNSVDSIEGYGFGKGYVHLFEEWRRFMGDLERHFRAGRWVVLIMHDRQGKVPNPAGEDWTRWEPRLHHSEKASILHATKEWVDHMLFVSYDVIAKDGKAKGGGTRTIYSVETPTYVAKTRTLDGTPIIYEKGSKTLWERLAGVPAAVAGDEAPPM
jgi:hypothetical protein